MTDVERQKKPINIELYGAATRQGKMCKFVSSPFARVVSEKNSL